MYLVEKEDSKAVYAMKELRKDQIIEEKMIKYLETEREVLNMTNHPFLLGLNYVFQTNTKIYFVMRFVRGGNLYKML